MPTVAEHERARIRLEDGKKNVLHALWSRSGKLRVHVASAQPSGGASETVMELTPDQVELLERFLQNGP
jgi:hypothetical protein